MFTLLNDFCFRIIMQFVAYENAASIYEGFHRIWHLITSFFPKRPSHMPMRCRPCRWVSRRRYRSKRRCGHRNEHFAWRTFCATFFAAHTFCFMIKLSTAQIANHLTQSTWTRQAMHFVFLQHLHLEKRIRSTWCLSNRRRNLLAHLTHGNGKGKGKGRKGNRNRIVNSNLATSEPPPTPEPAEDIRLAIQAALPDAARLCMQSELVASEWDVPTYPHQSLNKQDGISLVPKWELPGVISRIGFTANKFKVAILIYQNIRTMSVSSDTIGNMSG